MTKLIGIYGASGFGREVMSVAGQQAFSANADLVFIDDAADAKQVVNGRKLVDWQGFLATDVRERSAIIAIADSQTREKLFKKCMQHKVGLQDSVASSCFLGDDVHTGMGLVMQPFVTFTSNIRIGLGFHANIYSYVAHDCVIGDFVTFAPSVKCNGNVRIENHAYIGTGAVLRQGHPDKPLVIGEGAVVGMGAVVTKDVAPGVTVVGNPARILEK